MKKYVLLWIGIAVFMSTACKKYEEGPAISFRSAKNRIEGDWTLVSGTVDGENIYKTHIDTFTRNLSCGIVHVSEEQKIKKLIWKINDNSKLLWQEDWTERTLDSAFTIASSCIPSYKYRDYINITDDLTWKLEDNNKKIVITADGVEFFKLSILELRNKSMHLKGTIDGYQVDLKFEQ